MLQLIIKTPDNERFQISYCNEFIGYCIMNRDQRILPIS